MRIILSCAALFFSALLSGTAFAYVDYVPNENVREEVSREPFRLFPHTEHWAFAIDGDFYKPVFIGNLDSDSYTFDTYHGNGYWLTTRAEFKPNEQLALNLKLHLFHGSSSDSPGYLAILYPLVGLSYLEDLWDFHLKFRLSDIGRQTLGTGLFIEQKETEGGSMLAQKDQFKFYLMVDGTGSYRVEGGVIGIDTSLYDGLVGATMMNQEANTTAAPIAFTGSLYSKHDWDNGFGYGAELATANRTDAWLGYVQYQMKHDNLTVYLKPQFRHYGSRIQGGLARKIQNNYVSYDQNDKPYETFMNIMAFGDDVNTYSAQVNSEFVFNWFWRAFEEFEPYLWHFSSRRDTSGVFYRMGFKLYPFRNREDHFGITFGNKYLNASTASGAPSPTRNYSLPTALDLENKPLFFQQLYWMINYEVKF